MNNHENNTGNLLLELFSEEIPARMQADSEKQLENLFETKPKWQRASIMFAGPLANFLLSIFIFTAIFLNTIDPQTVPVIESTNQNISYSTNKAFEVGDKILSINGASVKDAKDINLELLSYAGFSGELNFSVLRPNSENLTNIIVNVTDFLPSSESQSDPTNYLGLDISYLMQPIIGKVLANGSAEI